MYIANQNFLHLGHMIKRGEEVANPDKRLIASGLIREIKIKQPTEVKTDEVVKSSTKRTRKSDNG
jgi:hypothetical protein